MRRCAAEPCDRETLLDRVAEAHLRVAYAARQRYRLNKDAIDDLDDLETAFQVAVLTLGVQTVLWAAALAVA